MITHLGPYKLLSKLGQGGMAEVFKAVKQGPQGFTKPVAVKRIIPPLADQQEFIDMLMSEAQLHARLQHPNLVQVIDFQADGDTYYLVLEYVDGVNVRQLERTVFQRHGKGLPWQVVVFILSETLKALHYVHHKDNLSIIHRDISPQNILISKDGGVKLSDFGVAWSNLRQHHTRTGILKGKIPYLSPEQLLAQAVDARSDLFSVAIVLYELICHHHPFTGATDYQTMRNIERGQYRDPRLWTPDLMQPLVACINSGLAVDVTRRFQEAQEFRNILVQSLPSSWVSDGEHLLALWLHNIYGQQPISPATPLRSTAVLPAKKQITQRWHTWLLAVISPLILGLTLYSYSDYFHFIRPIAHLENTELSLDASPPVLDVPEKAPADITSLSDPAATMKSTAALATVPTPRQHSTTPPRRQAMTTSLAPNKDGQSSPSNNNLVSLASRLAFQGPQGTSVYLNGKPLGKLPLDAMTIPQGNYMVLMRSSNGISQITQVQLDPGQEKTVQW